MLIMISNEIVPIFGVSFVLSMFTYCVTPKIGDLFRRMKIVGVDLHKPEHPKVPERGGVVILFSISALLAFIYFMTSSWVLLAVMASTVGFGLYGLLDDSRQLGKYKKLGLSLAISAALVLPFSSSLYYLPFLVFLTLAIGNIFNLFAGFNGLESGCSALVAFFFSLLCLLTGNLMPFCISMGVFLILFGFLMRNKYPASIFPGNVGTMAMGGFFAGLCLYYNLYALFVPLLFLHIADVLLKGASAGYFGRSEKQPTKVNGDRVLVPGNDYLSMCRLMLKVRPMTERQLVRSLWALEVLVGVSVVSVTAMFL